MSRNSRGYLLVNNDLILWTMLNAIKQQQTQIEALRRSVQKKDAQIQKLISQARESQNLQRQIAVVRARLAQVERKAGSPKVALLQRHRSEDNREICTHPGISGSHFPKSS